MKTSKSPLSAVSARSLRGRLLTTTSPNYVPSKPSIANIAEIRKILPGTSMLKAKEALASSENDLKKALAWLDKDMQASGAKKASKVGNREAKEGGIGVCILTDGAPSDATEHHAHTGMQVKGITLEAKAGIVELNCETDFVGRNEIFQALLKDIAHTVALYPSLGAELENERPTSSFKEQRMIGISPTQLLGFPLLAHPDSVHSQGTTSQKTVGEAILDVVSRLGERIHLARASALCPSEVPAVDAPRRRESSPWYVASAFTHGVGTPSSSSGAPGSFTATGRVGSLLLTRIKHPSVDAAVNNAQTTALRQDAASLKSLRGLTRSLARQAAGMPTQSIHPSSSDDLDTALYSQPFIMRLSAAQLPEAVAVGQHSQEAEESVGAALRSWGRAWAAVPSDSPDNDHVLVTALCRWQLGEPLGQ